MSQFDLRPLKNGLQVPMYDHHSISPMVVEIIQENSSWGGDAGAWRTGYSFAALINLLRRIASGVRVQLKSLTS